VAEAAALLLEWPARLDLGERIGLVGRPRRAVVRAEAEAEAEAEASV